jgi:RNA polymerase sigma factor (TIGR02999 family)
VSEITELLAGARGGDTSKLDEVFDALYPELKRLAAARAAVLAPGATLSTTELVHETYLKVVGSSSLDARDRRHFFACASKVMREILIDYLRAGSAAKRGGGVRPVTLPSQVGGVVLDTDLLDLHRALDDLDQVNPSLRAVAELRYFAGLSCEDIAELEECSVRTVQRNWKRARAFLLARLEQLRP